MDTGNESYWITAAVRTAGSTAILACHYQVLGTWYTLGTGGTLLTELYGKYTYFGILGTCYSSCVYYRTHHWSGMYVIEKLM